jgi:aspartate 1-decarboxylase
MRRTMMHSKIHRATVTDAHLDYVGSITIDSDLLEASGIVQHEKVQVVNINNGQRFETYVIEGRAGSGTIQLNGAAARLAHVGDKVIVIAYAEVEDAELGDFAPRVVHVDQDNRPLPALAR